MNQDFYKSLPKKRMASGAIFYNEKMEVLVVKPTYKEGWSIPGGVIELNESPAEGCRREVLEELSLDIKLKELLVVDYFHGTETYTESLQFIFYGGILNTSSINEIKLPPEELEKYKFINVEIIEEYLSGRLLRRVKQAIKALDEKKTFYLENQERFIEV
ncbi:NUDIX domain-containing protein [Oceanirhabdus sp. W0125-5]|uniref:NUDIX domain-containing protein n=1 Tax=Oceanirhabdus sp. W0125-5 TaxID=2999116 RepID=UPI0022F3173D|nr:NUDIX hydrolase [Oceanirhabdus sp. W0125-5]WBW99026.1 NUDIX hydrolase [Oceanirhabdus sp. W0125-5]